MDVKKTVFMALAFALIPAKASNQEDNVIFQNSRPTRQMSHEEFVDMLKEQDDIKRIKMIDKIEEEKDQKKRTLSIGASPKNQLDGNE